MLTFEKVGKFENNCHFETLYQKEKKSKIQQKKKISKKGTSYFNKVKKMQKIKMSTWSGKKCTFCKK